MNEEFITLTPENLADEHLCCIIRSKKPHPGVEAKRQWLAERIKELPCVFNNYAVFYKGDFQTVHLVDAAYLDRILKK